MQQRVAKGKVGDEQVYVNNSFIREKADVISQLSCKMNGNCKPEVLHRRSQPNRDTVCTSTINYLALS
jgi:hypothetical protein